MLDQADTESGFGDFCRAVADILRDSRAYIDVVIPYAEAAAASEIRRTGQLISEEYEEDGIHVKAYVPRDLASRMMMKAAGKPCCYSKSSSQSSSQSSPR